MSQPASAAPSRKKTVISLLVLAALTGIIVLLFKDNWAEITAALSQLSAWQVLVVLAIGLSYPLLEGCVAWVIVRSRIPGFRLWQGIDTAWCGTFGNVVTLGAGASAGADLVSAPLRPAGWPGRGPDDPAVRVPQNHRAAVCHGDAAVSAQMACRQHHRCDELSAHGIRCSGGHHCGAGAGVRIAAGAGPCPLADASAAQNGKMAAAPRRLAAAAGCSGRGEPPSAGR